MSEHPPTVAEIMTADPATIGPDEPLERAEELLAEPHIGALPVVDARGDVVGLVTEHDLVRRRVEAEELLEHGALGSRGMRLLFQQGARVRDVMRHPAVTIEATAPLAEAERLLVDHDLDHLPVTREGRLVGIVSEGDCLKRRQ